MDEARHNQASRLMLEFAAASGLSSERPPRRYLWTDAHAVCNFLTLASATGDANFSDLAIALVDQVHDVLGRHRVDDDRSGWLSGLEETQGRQHPTVAGLRIGKPLPEQRPGEPYDEHAEWERDGQYYHYLTKWTHALCQLAGFTGESRYLVWAKELAITAHERFKASSGPTRLYWKMSIDLSYPLVPSSGLHDPLDGLVTALTLKAADADRQAVQLDRLIAELTALCRGRQWETDDPLGIGGLLFDAARLVQLPECSQQALISRLLDGAGVGLITFLRASTLQQPGSQRLAFRELGLSIGLHAVELISNTTLSGGLPLLLDRFHAHGELGDAIERFWLDPVQQRTATWAAHRDINAVMLATSLAPNGFLSLQSGP